MKAFLLSCVLYLSSLSTPPTYDLEVKVEGLRNQKGKVYIGVYDTKEDFEGMEKIVDGAILEAGGERMSHVFRLPAKTYAIAVFHDENGNGQLDKNFLGIPKEGYGFSSVNNKRGFDNCSFLLNSNKRLRIQLKY